MGETFSAEAILSAVDRGFISTMKKAQNSVSALGKISSGLKFGAVMAAGGKMFSTLASGAKGFVSELNASQATWKTFEGNMKYFKKSKEEIKKVKAELSEFATKSVYNGSDMASTYSQLMALGVKDTGNLVKAFGGLAAAAENPRQAMKTLSQQGAQMAAKPTVAWQDYKLMLEQSQSGMAAVAKEMGMSAGEMTQKIQEGKVKTEDFFNAMKKAAGEGTEFERMATTYKDMGSAIDGVKESLTTKLAPAWDVVSDYGIKAIGKFEGVLGKIDGNKIAKVLSVGLSKASSVASKVFSKIAPVAASAGKTLYNFGKAVFDVGRSIATNKTVVDGFKKTLSTLGNGVTKVSGFMSKHSSTIGKVAPLIALLTAGYLSLNKATGILGKVGAKSASTGLSGISTALNKLNPTGVLSLAGSVGIFVAALGAMSAMKGIIIPFLSGLVGVFGQVMEVIRANTDVILTLVNGALTALANAIVTVAPAMQPIAAAFASLSPLITAVGTAIATILPALGPVITALGTAISAVVGAIGKAVSGIAKAITPIVQIVANAIVRIVQALAPYIPEITKMVQATSQAVQAVAGAFGTLFSNLSSIFNSIASVIQTLANGAVAVITAFANGASQVMTTFGNMISQVLTSAGNFFTTFASAVSTVLQTFGTTVSTILTSVGTLFTNFGTAVSTVMNSVSGVVTAVGGAIKGVLDGIAGIFDSMGTAALNAGKGVVFMAKGLKTLVGLSLADLAGTLGAVAIGLGKISSTGSGVSKAGNGISKLATASKSASTGLSSMSKAIGQAVSAMSRLASSAASTASRMSSAGKTAGTSFANGLGSGMKAASTQATSALRSITTLMQSSARTASSAGKQMGTGFTTGLQSGMLKARTVASSVTKTVASAIRSGHGAASSAGKYVGQGVASGLRSALGAVKSAANAIIAEVNRAMQAKAKIHSPSKLTNKEVGVPLGRGVVVGLKSQTAAIESAARDLVHAGISKLQAAAASSEGGYAKAWESVSEQFGNSMSSTQTRTLKQAKEYSQKVAEQFYDSSAISAVVKSNEAQLKAIESRLSTLQDESENRIAAIEQSGEAAVAAIEARGEKLEAKKSKLDLKSDKRSKKKKKQLAKLIKANTAAAKASSDQAAAQIEEIKQTTSAQIKALNARKRALTKTNTEYNKLISRNTKLASKLQTKLYGEYEQYIKEETKKATSAVKKQMDKITDKYQAMYDKIASQRSSFLDKLQDYGSLYSADQYGYVTFKNWKAQLKEITKLGGNLKKLQQAGASQGFISEITSMSTTEALTYTNALIKKGTGFIREQSNGFDALMKKSSQISTRIYKPYVDAVDKAYNHDLVNALSGLDKKLEQIGRNAAAALKKGLTTATKNLSPASVLPKPTKKAVKKAVPAKPVAAAAQQVGIQAQTGFALGIMGGSAAAAKASSAAAIRADKAARKKLKIHSPSRVFADIGRMTGLGFANGIDAVGRRIRTATMDMIRIPTAESPRLAYAGDTRLNDNYTYGGSRYEITVVSEIDGKEFARATVDPMSEELERKNRNTNRSRGRRT